MADYKISIGAELRTKDIDTAVKNYKGEVKIGTELDTDGITTAISGYKAPKVIEVKSKLLTKGITDVINKYKNSKAIKVLSDLDTDGIDNKISTYKPSKSIMVDVDLNPKSINQKIAEYNASSDKVSIELNAELNDKAIGEAIKEFNTALNSAESKTKIKVGVDPDFDGVDKKVSEHVPRTLMKINAKINKGQIDKSIKEFQTSAALRISNVELTENAIKKALTLYNPEAPVPVKVDFVLGKTNEVDTKIQHYKTTPVPISAKLVPSSRGFISGLTKDPVYVDAALKPDAINDAITNAPKNLKPISLDVKLVPKDINGQIKQLPKPTEPLNVDVKLNETSVNNAITNSHPTALLDVGVKLDDDNINAQIEAIHPSAKIKVDVDINNNDINKDASSQSPVLVNIKLDRDKINEQIRNFKTKTKITVGVKLDFASHKGGQKGIPQQIKDYKTSAKIKVGVELDKDSITQEIANINTGIGAPIQLGVELDPNGVRRIHDQIDNIRQRLQQLGNITINLNPPVGGGGSGGNGANNIVDNIDAIRAHINNARSDIADFRRSLASMDFDRDTIAAVTRDLERLDLTVTDVTSTFRNNRLTVAVDGIDQAQRAVTVIKEYNEVGQHLNTTTRIRQSFGEDAEAARQLEERLSRLKAIAAQMNNLEVDIFKLNDNPNAHVNEIEALERQLESFRRTYDRLISEIDLNDLTGRQVLELSAPFADAMNQLDRLEAAFADTRAKLANGIEVDLKEGKFAAQVAKVTSDAKKLSNVSVDLRTKLNVLETTEKEMNSAFNNGTIEQRIQAYKNYERALESVRNQLQLNKIEEKDSLDAVSLGQARDKLSLDIGNWLKDNSAAAKDFGARLKEIQNDVKTADSATLTRLRAEFVNIKKEAQQAGKATQTFADRIKHQFSKYKDYLSIAMLFNYAEQGMRDMFRQVVAIDTAMTELKKVTDETDASYNKFLTNSASRAKELGTTIDGLVTSTADFARLGYGFEDAQGLAEVANIYAVVGDEIEGVEDATQSLVSTLAAFKSEMGGMSDSDFAMSIVDKMNEVSNNFAISSGGIGQALQRSASSMAAANNSLDETIAMITAANTVAQNPEKVGNAFKTKN